jgi:hypothetical protein
MSPSAPAWINPRKIRDSISLGSNNDPLIDGGFDQFKVHERADVGTKQRSVFGRRVGRIGFVSVGNEAFRHARIHRARVGLHDQRRTVVLPRRRNLPTGAPSLRAETQGLCFVPGVGRLRPHTSRNFSLISRDVFLSESSRYRLFVKWATIEDHPKDFRG